MLTIYLLFLIRRHYRQPHTQPHMGCITEPSGVCFKLGLAIRFAQAERGAQMLASMGKRWTCAERSVVCWLATAPRGDRISLQFDRFILQPLIRNKGPRSLARNTGHTNNDLFYIL